MMTQREKILEILSKKIYPKEGVDYAEVVADFLLDSGIVVLPCKVGDTVYVVDGKIIYEATVTMVESNLFTNPREWITYRYNARFLGLVEKKTRIDLLEKENVFLTHEGAEIAIRQIGEVEHERQ